MKQLMLSLSMIVLLAPFTMAYAPSEPNPDATCQENLAQCQVDIQKLLAINQNLTRQLDNMNAQRDHYRTLYEQTLLENFSVQRLDAFEQHIINNNYENNMTIYEIKQTINNIKVYQLIILVALIFEISLFGFTFFKQRVLFKKTEMLLTKINAISIKTEENQHKE